jgi:predicted TIM-barrel fold metal-dependent hydrolase
MMDAYTHLDVTAPDPVADFKSRMVSAEIDRALVVETWKGDNYPFLSALIASELREFRVVPCFRPEGRLPTLGLLDHPMVAGLRAKTADLHCLDDLAERLESLEKWLVPHAEQGIVSLAAELATLLGRFPGLKVYLPHCAWPRQNQLDDDDWERSIAELSALPNVILGISAISYFSSEPFPHDDVRPFAVRLVEIFGANSIVAASDYPMFEKARYADYIRLAQRWIEQQDANWSPRFEALIFK